PAPVHSTLSLHDALPISVRGRAMGVRVALGVSQVRLIAQLLTESLVLCVLGGAAGLVTGWALIRVASPLLKRSLPYTTMPEVDLDRKSTRLNSSHQSMTY